MANADFERLTDFLSRMIEKYGDRNRSRKAGCVA